MEIEKKAGEVGANFASQNHGDCIAAIPEGQRYLADLRANLTPARLEHSLEVMAVMDRLAQVYGLEREQALTAGLLPDAAKDFSDVQLVAMAEAAGLPLADPCDRHPLYLHGPVGTVYVRDRLGVSDALVLDAIHTHSLVENGSDFHAPFSWCLRFADILAPSRSWKDFHAQLGPVVYAGDLRQGALMVLEWIFVLFARVGNPVHPRLAVILDEYKRRDKAQR
jgi:predicted HD superfamily hydrolase involved in NAD metabolism